VKLLELFYRRCQAQLAANQLLDAAALASRALTAQETLQFEELVSTIAKIDKQIEERSALAA
jgi:hypothetical protein